MRFGTAMRPLQTLAAIHTARTEKIGAIAAVSR